MIVITVKGYLRSSGMFIPLLGKWEQRKSGMEDCVVRMEGICKYFGEKVALEHASIELHEGEVLGLVGDNGAGKSTLLKTLAGVFPKDSGDIFIKGRKVRINSPRQSRSLGIEMVYQDMSLCGSLNAWENIYLGRYHTHPLRRSLLPILDKRSMARKALQSLRNLGIDLTDINGPVRNLSGGQQQAVAICRCQLFRPGVILLDEPTASMGMAEREKVLDMILDLKDQGSSIIMVTHNLQELFQVADRALVVKEGRSIWCGPLEGMEPENLAQMMFVGRA